MIEFCSFRRMLASIVLFITASTIVFLLEEYYDEDVLEKDVITAKKAIELSPHTLLSSSPASPPELPHNPSLSKAGSTCWLHEQFQPVSLCQPCSDFELNAMKADYCAISGYFDKLNCSSGKIGLRPCLTKGVYAETRFNMFMAVMAALTGVSAGVVHWRQSLLDRRAYARVQQQLGGGV
uniref:Protein JTB n=1 Tax=Plectus sambesii TaxID=2011161 RepID=A0A914X3F9_9BILA